MLNTKELDINDTISSYENETSKIENEIDKKIENIKVESKKLSASWTEKNKK